MFFPMLDEKWTLPLEARSMQGSVRVIPLSGAEQTLVDGPKPIRGPARPQSTVVELPRPALLTLAN